MDPHGPGFFILDMLQHSSLETSIKDARIKRILDQTILDQFQLEDFKRSTTASPGGVMLIQGPPGILYTRLVSSAPDLRKWRGSLIRFRSPSWQTYVICKESKTQPLVKSPVDVSAVDKKLQKLQLNTMIESYAAWKDNEEEKACKK
ncbi:unnamed protein product [Penicillium pancosmium]